MSDTPIPMRRIFAHSSARADAALTNRARKLTRAKEDLDRMVSGLGGRFYPTEKKVADRLQQIARDRKIGPYLRYTIGTAPSDTTPLGAPEGTCTGRGATKRPVPKSPAPTRRADPARPTPGRAPAQADPANPPSPGGPASKP